MNSSFFFRNFCLLFNLGHLYEQRLVLFFVFLKFSLFRRWFLVFPFLLPKILHVFELLIATFPESLIKSFVQISVQNTIFTKIVFLFVVLFVSMFLGTIIYLVILKRCFVTVISYHWFKNYAVKIVLLLPTIFLFMSYLFSPFSHILTTQSKFFSPTIQKISEAPVFDLAKMDNNFIREKNPTYISDSVADIRKLLSFKEN